MRTKLHIDPRRRSGGTSAAPRSAKAGRSGSPFPRRRPGPLTRRAVLTVLICASLGLVTATYRGGVVLSGAQLGVLHVVAPIERGLTRAWQPLADGWNWTGRLFSATSDVPRLERENAQLRGQLNVAEHQLTDYTQLRRDLGFKLRGEYPAGYELQPARVVVMPTGSDMRTLTIDSGTDDGIREGDSVIADGALVGIVDRASSSDAVVSLILDDTLQVSASVSEEGSDAWGILETISTEGAPIMQLRQVKQSATVHVYDNLVTSGFSRNGLTSRYPAGIPIGQVTSVRNDSADVYKTVQVSPYADVDRLDHVYVLVPKERD